MRSASLNAVIVEVDPSPQFTVQSCVCPVISGRVMLSLAVVVRKTRTNADVVTNSPPI